MEAYSLTRRAPLALPRSARLLSALPDTKLVEQVRRGNEAAFEAIYDRHHRALLSFCRHMLGSQEEGEDALQHTFLSAHGALLERDEAVNVKPWLYAIARNRCLSMLRARRAGPSDDIEISTAGLSEEVERRADLRELLGDLEHLPEDQRGALVLTEIGDLTHAEVAGVIGCKESKVKSLVFQARSALIEQRDARDASCVEIREQLATVTGGALRRGPLRKHLKMCSGCADFRDQVRRQRAAIAVLLPVAPSMGLKQAALAAVLGKGAGGVAAGLGTAAGRRHRDVLARSGLGGHRLGWVGGRRRGRLHRGWSAWRRPREGGRGEGGGHGRGSGGRRRWSGGHGRAGGQAAPHGQGRAGGGGPARQPGRRHPSASSAGPRGRTCAWRSLWRSGAGGDGRSRQGCPRAGATGPKAVEAQAVEAQAVDAKAADTQAQAGTAQAGDPARAARSHHHYAQAQARRRTPPRAGRPWRGHPHEDPGQAAGEGEAPRPRNARACAGEAQAAAAPARPGKEAGQGEAQAEGAAQD